ncbi:MAG: ADP-ribosylglycohydrolase family protein [Victivallales bacterium]|nr:ADP-ribosylglycohydrolase family protein [Victivallales bacterium]
MPEDFAAILKSDPVISEGIFLWDNIHTVQELLQEGMNPRLSGFGTVPCGLICAAMPAVGIYHCGDPEYAYLDGIELASVVQPRLGADWAALCAAAISAAFEKSASGDSVVNAVMNIAHANNKELFYKLHINSRHCGHLAGSSETSFLNWWFTFCREDLRKERRRWRSGNPVEFVLPLLKYCGSDAMGMMNLLTWANDPGIPAIIGGAVIGAIHGADIFPESWQSWAGPIIELWLGMTEVVGKRLTKEKQIICTVTSLQEKVNQSETFLSDRIYGCLLAGAIGNAMGSPVEGRQYQDIEKEYPEGITTVLDPSRLESEDDNQMCAHLINTYLERDGLPVMARHFGLEWRENLNSEHYYAQCMGHAYDLICADWDPRITGHWSVVTGSTVMCMEPAGIYNLADPEYAFIDACAISYMYQRGLDVVSAAILAAAVSEAMRPGSSVESICSAALEAAPKEKLRTFDERRFKSVHEYLDKCLQVAAKYTNVLEARRELYERCLFYHMIDPLEVLGLSLAMFKIADGDVEQAAIGGTNIGRDSDTIAGRAAMLSGTLRGSSGIPGEWIGLFNSASLEKIKSNAMRMADLIGVQKMARLQKRQALIQWLQC